uniref:Perilipin-1 n=1 Tax=Oryzias sinensis TaxID=183150 RepID=A0A8C7YBZ0_9TELE
MKPTEKPNFSHSTVVSRVTNLTLVSSACEVVSSAYSSTKDSVPLLKGVMDAAESGVRTLGAAAAVGSKPIMDMIEPQRKSFSPTYMGDDIAILEHIPSLCEGKHHFWVYLICLLHNNKLQIQKSPFLI